MLGARSAAWHKEPYALHDGHHVTPELVAQLSPYIREHIRRFGKFVLDMEDLPGPLNPKAIPFAATP